MNLSFSENSKNSNEEELYSGNIESENKQD
jgi:hypothetical protein